ALFVFCFIGAVQDGLAALTRDRAADRTLVVFQANRFCPSTSRLPEDYARAVGQLPGVRDVVPIKVFMNNCRASLDLVVFHGLPPEKLKAIRDFRIVDGSWDEFELRRDAALVGQSLARRRGLNVGKRFSIGQVAVTVAGIYSTDRPGDDNVLSQHLAFLHRS